MVLRGPERQRRAVTIRALVSNAGFRPVPSGTGPSGRMAGGLAVLTDGQRQQLRLRVAHLLEAETGFRSGNPLRALDRQLGL